MTLPNTTMARGGSRRQLLAKGATLCAGLTALNLAGGTPAAASSPAPPPSAFFLPAQAPATEGVARLADVGLWYWDTGGSGETIVLLHPFTGSGQAWPFQQPAFAKAGFRVIGYSRRGYAGSEAGPKDRPGSGGEDLRQLLDLLAVERFHAVAASGGSFVAVDFAISHPERLQSLVLACSRLGVPDSDFGPLVEHLTPPGFAALPAEFRELSPSYRSANPAGVVQWMARERAARPDGAPQQQPYINRVTPAALERIRTPTLLIGGESDLIAPPPILRALARHIPNCRVSTFPECGHAAPWEQPALFNRTVVDFLRSRRA
jgi:pimeloyl-ACP methyl ester carboxylesterase